MANSIQQLLVGDRFRAECQEPKPKKRNIIHLKRNASCSINRDTNPRELSLIEIRFTGWEINKKNIMNHPKELCCFCCNSEEKSFYKWHTGSDKVRPFMIDRIERSPALCTKPILGAIEPYAEIREVIDSDN